MTVFVAAYSLANTIMNAPRGTILPVLTRPGQGTITGITRGLADIGVEISELEFIYAFEMTDMELSAHLRGILVDDKVLVVSGLGSEGRDVHSRRIAAYVREAFCAQGGRAIVVEYQ